MTTGVGGDSLRPLFVSGHSVNNDKHTVDLPAVDKPSHSRQQKALTSVPVEQDASQKLDMNTQQDVN